MRHWSADAVRLDGTPTAPDWIDAPGLSDEVDDLSWRLDVGEEQSFKSGAHTVTVRRNPDWTSTGIGAP